MYIESKLKEVDRMLFSLDLSKINRAEITSDEIILKTPSGLNVNSKIQCGMDFFSVDTVLESTQKITDIFSICGEYVQISYLGRGESQMIYSGERTAIGFGSIQCCYDCDTENHMEMPALCPTHYQAIFLSKAYYLELLKYETWAGQNIFYKKIEMRERLRMGQCKYPVNYKLHQLFSEITECEWKQDLKKYYLELKLKELFLYLHVCQCENTAAENSGLTTEHFEKVETAQALLLENYKNPPTIKALSRSVLLNELQLKQGFKKVYGKTIRSFVIELRMKKARSLVGKYTVNEIAGILGYKSVPHFINTFKKYYGHTPKQTLS